MHATTARGTDAERTEDAAPVEVENVVVDAEARLVLADVDVGLEVVAVLVLFPLERLDAAELVTGTSDSDADTLVRSVGTDGGDTVSVLGITLGNVSVAPASLHKNLSESRWNSAVKNRGTHEDTSGGGETVGPCGTAMAATATARRVKN